MNHLGRPDGVGTSGFGLLQHANSILDDLHLGRQVQKPFNHPGKLGGV